MLKKIVLWLVGGFIPNIPNGVSAPVHAYNRRARLAGLVFLNDSHISTKLPSSTVATMLCVVHRTRMQCKAIVRSLDEAM